MATAIKNRPKRRGTLTTAHEIVISMGGVEVKVPLSEVGTLLGGGGTFDIDALPAAGALAGADLVPVSQSGTESKVSLSSLAAFMYTGIDTSAEIAAIVTDELGSSGGGLLVFNQSPTIVTPTIASFVNSNHTHLNAAGGGTLTYAAIAQTTSVNWLTRVSDATGSGAWVFATSPTIVTPTIASFANAAHNHANAAGGGQITLTTGVTGALPVANGGTGTSTAFTAGSIVFAGASGVYSQDNATLFWNNTTKRFGIGTSSPNAPLGFATGTVGPPAASGSGLRISMYPGDDRYAIGLDSSTLWFSSQTYIKFYSFNGATATETVRFDVGANRYLFGNPAADDGSSTFQVGGNFYVTGFGIMTGGFVAGGTSIDSCNIAQLISTTKGLGLSVTTASPSSPTRGCFHFFNTGADASSYLSYFNGSAWKKVSDYDASGDLNARRLNLNTADGTNHFGIRLTSSATDATVKRGGIRGGHYTASEEDIVLFRYASGSTSSSVMIGDNTGDANGVTDFYVALAANNTTLGGTLMAQWNRTGLRLEAGVSASCDAGCMIDMVSTAQGLGLPVMSAAQRNAITARKGTALYVDTGTDATSYISYWNGTAWVALLGT